MKIRLGWRKAFQLGTVQSGNVFHGRDETPLTKVRGSAPTR
jgi:hypothetical protein